MWQHLSLVLCDVSSICVQNVIAYMKDCNEDFLGSATIHCNIHHKEQVLPTTLWLTLRTAMRSLLAVPAGYVLSDLDLSSIWCENAMAYIEDCSEELLGSASIYCEQAQGGQDRQADEGFCSGTKPGGFCQVCNQQVGSCGMIRWIQKLGQ